MNFCFHLPGLGILPDALNSEMQKLPARPQRKNMWKKMLVPSFAKIFENYAIFVFG